MVIIWPRDDLEDSKTDPTFLNPFSAQSAHLRVSSAHENVYTTIFLELLNGVGESWKLKPIKRAFPHLDHSPHYPPILN